MYNVRFGDDYLEQERRFGELELTQAEVDGIVSKFNVDPLNVAYLLEHSDWRVFDDHNEFIDWLYEGDMKEVMVDLSSIQLLNVKEGVSMLEYLADNKGYKTTEGWIFIY